MANVTKKTSADYLADYEEAITKANQIIRADEFDHAAYDEAIKDIKTAEAGYASSRERELFEEYSKKDNPREAILRLWRFEVISHKEVRDKKQDNKLKLVEKTKKLANIDYFAFCKYCDFSLTWNDALGKFNYLMALKKASAVGNDGRAIKESYKMTEDARKMALGVTLTSNRQMCKALQLCIDLMLDNKKPDGSPKYRVTNHDVEFFEDIYTSVDKRNARPGIKVSRDKTVRDALVAIASHLIVGDMYGVHGFAGEAKEDKKNSTATTASGNPNIPTLATVEAKAAAEAAPKKGKKAAEAAA